jgi:hypothetical protein
MLMMIIIYENRDLQADYSDKIRKSNGERKGKKKE